MKYNKQKKTSVIPFYKRIVSCMFSMLILIMYMIFIQIPSVEVSALKATKKSGFTIPTLSENQAANVVAIASANIGKKSADFGYSGSWCAYFATDCAELAGVSKSVVPSYGSTTLFYENMINKRGATKIVTHEWNSSTVNVLSDPKPGDYILIRWDGKGYTDGKGVDSKGNKIEAYCMKHTALVVSYNSSTKTVTYVGGNQGDGTNTTNPVSKESCSVTNARIARIIRPNYPSTVPIYEPGSVSGTYYLKNNSTGTYAYMNGSDADTTDISLSAKKTTAAYQMKFTPVNSDNTQMGSYIMPSASTTRVLNPYADNPVDGTVVNLYKKTSDGTQQWVFESVKDGYVIRNYMDLSLVLTANGSSVKVNTYSSGNKNQIWSLEEPSVSVNAVFHRNQNAEDSSTATETFTTGVSNQKFGYLPDGTGRYSTMNEASVGFGKWINPGYKLLGWSTDQNATTARWKTYSAVEDAWIKMYSPKVDLYAVWEADSPKEGDVNTDGKFDTADVVLFQKWLLAVPDTELQNSEVADINEDDKLNILDFCVMKNKLIYG